MLVLALLLGQAACGSCDVEQGFDGVSVEGNLPPGPAAFVIEACVNEACATAVARSDLLFDVDGDLGLSVSLSGEPDRVRLLRLWLKPHHETSLEDGDRVTVRVFDNVDKSLLVDVTYHVAYEHDHGCEHAHVRF